MLLKLALSITSFLPLYILISIMYGHQYYINNNDRVKKYMVVTLIILFIIQIISITIVNIYLKRKENLKISENEINFSNINEDKKAYVNYMMTYLLPLLSFNTDKIDIFYLFYSNIVIFIFIYINAKAENFNFNPILSLKGYVVYTGIRNDGSQKILLIKKRQFSNIRANHKKYKFVSFGGSNDIYLCKKYE